MDLLSQYPDLSPDRREELVRWFRKDASALDVGYIAMDEKLSYPYALFKRDELEPFTLREIVFIVLVCTMLFAVMVGVGYLDH